MNVTKKESSYNFSVSNLKATSKWMLWLFNLSQIYKEMKEVKLNPVVMLIVRDYLTVFPEDLPELPSAREIEFIIKLISETIPISKAP